MLKVHYEELVTIYQGVLLRNYDRKRKYWSRLEEFITAEMTRLPEKADKCGMLDYYGNFDFSGFHHKYPL